MFFAAGHAYKHPVSREKQVASYSLDEAISVRYKVQFELWVFPLVDLSEDLVTSGSRCEDPSC